MQQTHTVLDTNVLRIVIGLLQRNSGYSARQEIERLNREIALDPRRLEPFGFKVYSQGDEDGILEEIFKRLQIQAGTFVEIGVENGLECNSLYLLHKGWRGAWIEGNPRQEEPIRQKFKVLFDQNRLQLRLQFVYPDNINELIRSCLGHEQSLDFLSIDIDGNDYYLLESLEILPKVLCVEYNSKWRGNISKVPVYTRDNAWRGTDWMGASLLALTDLAHKKGYKLVGTNLTGANAFFVREDLVADHFVDDKDVAQLYNPARYWLIFDHFHHIGHPADFGPYTDFFET